MRVGSVALSMVLLVGSLLGFLVVPAGGHLGAFLHPGAPVASPTTARSSAAPSGGAGLVPAHASAPSAAAPSGAISSVNSPASSPAANANCPATPSFPPTWSSSNFFNDVQVTFSVPGSPALSGSKFYTVPCFNNIPTFTNGFWMNITTNVRISGAFLFIWDVHWSADPALSQNPYDPATPRFVPMTLIGPSDHEAVYYFNNYRNFWPGTQVYFNATLTSVNATPSVIQSAYFGGQWRERENYSGIIDNASWKYQVNTPWASSNFSQDIAVSTTPSTLTSPPFFPNMNQGVLITLNSIGHQGLPATPIPAATGYVTLNGPTNPGYFQFAVGPFNHTAMTNTHLLGPEPLDTAQFNFTAWLPWGPVGGIDRINSPVYSFNWTKYGGWWYPQLGLQGNLQLSITPSLVQSVPDASLPTGTDVNVTIHEPIQNVTINSSSLHFRYTDPSGAVVGTIPMVAANANTSYAVIPGMPANSHVVFSVQSKDIFLNPIASGNYSYSESGPMTTAPPPGAGLFFFEAVDLAGTGLVPNLNYTVQNGSWSQTGVATPLGFGVPRPLAGGGFLFLSFGSYVLTIHAFGETEVAAFKIVSSTPSDVIFYVASAPYLPSVGAPSPTFTIPATVGLIGAAVTMVPVARWFRERRKKAEAEQRRITL